MDTHFRVQNDLLGHFETSLSVLNDLKMTLNTKRSNVLHVYVTATHASKISLLFALRLGIF